MGDVAFRALLASVMGLGIDLLVPGRAGGIGLVAADTHAVSELGRLGHIGLVGVVLAWPVAPFTGERLVAVLRQLLGLILVALLARFLAGVDRVDFLSGGFAQQRLHRWAFIQKNARPALWLSQRQRLL